MAFQLYLQQWLTSNVFSMLQLYMFGFNLFLSNSFWLLDQSQVAQAHIVRHYFFTFMGTFSKM